MPKYRKKPVEVEAYLLKKTNADELAKWCGGLVIEEVNPADHLDIYVGVNIPTLEGTMRASEGDYIIRGVRGEFYPCKPGIFDDTYELANG
jgi:hypothetical protein